MYKTKQNYLRFKTHEIFSDKFSKEYPKEQMRYLLVSNLVSH